MADRATWAPWLVDTRETCGGVLQPLRHHGTANYLDPGNPCAIFEAMTPREETGGPVVAITSAGWNRDGLDMSKVRESSAGVMAVRMSMTGVPGMHTQHSFFFPGVFEVDPMTVTFWQDEASLRAFAYGPGSHRRQLDRHRADDLTDRTSFTRFRALHSAGTRHGRDPVRFD